MSPRPPRLPRRGWRVAGWLLPALGLASCESPELLGLPTMVNILARLEDGANVSMLVDLEAPRERPTLRVSRGLVSYDGQRLLELQPSGRMTPEGLIAHELKLADLLRGAESTVRVAAGGGPGERLEVVHLRERTALLRLVGPEGVLAWYEMILHTGELRELEEAHAIRRFERYGPERGFTVTMDEDQLVLALPRGGQGDAFPLLGHVDGVVTVNWIAEEYFADRGPEELSHRFKMAGSVVAMAQECEPDGDLREWTRDQALSVGSEAHVAQGLSSWSNARDASFALAARLAPHELCAAVRVRDDHLVAGADALLILTEGHRFQLDVPARPGPVDAPGLRGAFTDQASFGVGVEFCLHPSVWTVHEGHVPFRVLYRDQDPGEELTVLASAPEVPWPALAGVRLPRRGQEGALPPR